MKIGMIGLGRMGSNMVRRILKAGHEAVVYDVDAEAVKAISKEGAEGVESLEALVAALPSPHVVWMMLPVAFVDETIEKLKPLLEENDILVDGGNSKWLEDIRRSKQLARHGIRYLDSGVSGGVWGLERGYCVMVGGDEDACTHIGPVLKALAPGESAAPATPSRGERQGTAPDGYLRCGGPGAGHFVKMVHNGIEYGVMAAYAEGFNVLRHAGVGNTDREEDAETAPLADPEAYGYDFDVAEVAEVWRRGTVIQSWLLDLTADALARDPKLHDFQGRVSDSGEGRWTVQAAVETGAPVPIISQALFERFASRGESHFSDKLLSAMRSEFGGHAEKKDD